MESLVDGGVWLLWVSCQIASFFDETLESIRQPRDKEVRQERGKRLKILLGIFLE